jgi:ribonucleoside-diphosphate reductase beta chain
VSTVDVESKFHFSREMLAGPIYRKYEKAIRKVWSVEDLDFTQDALDWQRITPEQQKGLLGVTVRFLAGEQAVTDELVPMLAASHALGRFDWVMFLSSFMLDEARHSEFFAVWHRDVAGITTAEGKAAHWPPRTHTVDPTGRFQVGEPVYEGIPRLGEALMEAVRGGDRRGIEEGFIRFSTLYNAWVEGVLTMPTYEIVMDITNAWGVLPTLQAGFKGILADEGRHITFGTEACAILIREHPEYEALVHEVITEYRGTNDRPSRQCPSMSS